MNLLKLKVGFIFYFLLLAEMAAGQQYQLQFTQQMAFQKIHYNGDVQRLEFCGLTPNQEYSVELVKDRFNDTHFYTLNGQRQYSYTFVPSGTCMDLEINHEGMFLKSIAEEFPLKFIFKEKHQPVESRSSTFRASPNNNARSIVEEFVGDVCGEIVEGSIVARGLLGNMTGGLEVLGFESGVVLSTIDPRAVASPNRSPGDTPDDNAIPEFDADLRRLVGGSIFTNKRGVYDITVIEFDFVPTSDEISFEYVFASEEYCEYVNEYNDAFGFFLSGPGINGPFSRNAENIALIPNSNDYVTINNVNHNKNSEYYINNTPNNIFSHEAEVNECPNSLINFPAPHADVFEMDGYTVPLIAKSEVIPCETYHLKLVIGDAFDDGFSSSVFLRSKSFKSTGDVYVEFDFPNGDSILYEGCDQKGIVRFVRTDEGTEDIIIDVATGGTAQLGIDLDVSFGEQIVIPPGGIVEEEITIYEDIEVEDPETFSIDIGVACTCDRPFYEFTIIDVPELQVDLIDTTHCSNDGALELKPTVSGGLPAVAPNEVYSYEWSTGATEPTLPISPNTKATYSVSVTDGCGKIVSDDAFIDAKETVSATLSGDAPQNCTDTSAQYLTITFTGDAPFYFSYSINNQISELIATSDFEYQLPISSEGLYRLESVANDYCEGDVFGSVQVDFLPLLIDFEIDSILCGGIADGAIRVVELDDKEYSYRWNTGSTSLEIDGLAAGTYSLEVDSRTCTETYQFQLTEPPVMEISSQVTALPDCANPLGGAIDLEVSGGIPGYAFSWSAMPGDRTTEDVSGLPSGDYEVRVLDEAGCEKSFLTTIARDADLPNANIVPPDSYTCTLDEVALQAEEEISAFAYLWETSDGGLDGATDEASTTATAPAVYQLSVRNEDTGCENYGFTEVRDARFYPEVLLGQENYFCRIPSIMYEVPFDPANDYAWTALTGSIVGGRNSAVLEVDQPGLYQLEVTDRASGCTSMDTLEIINNSILPEANAGPEQILTCREDILDLGDINNGLGDNLRVEWSGPSFIGSPTDSIIQTIVPGVFTVRVYNETNGCFGADEVVVEEDKNEPEIDAGEDGLYTCTENFIALNGANLNTERTNDVLWTSPDGVISGDENAYVSEGNAPGIYYLNAVDVFSGCEAIDSMRILPDPNLPLAQIQGGGILTCTEQEIELTGQTDAGNQFVWRLPNNSQNSSDIDIIGQDSGQYVFEVTRPADNCVNRTSVSLGLDLEPPSDSIRPFDLLYCSDLTETLNVFEPNVTDFAYNWQSADGQINSNPNRPSIEIEGAGQYVLQIIRQRNGCPLMLTADVQEFDNVPTDFDANVRQPECPSDLGAVSFGTVQGGVLPYRYSLTSNFAPQRNYIDLAPGDYTLSIQDGNGCIISKDTTIIPPRDIFLSSEESDKVVQLGERYTPSISTNVPLAEVDTLIWTPFLNDPSCTFCYEPSFIPFEPTEMTLELVDTFGCRLETNFSIFVDTRVDIFVPNIFGPNFEMKENQLAQIFGRETAIKQVNKYYIFDRWGELIFQRENFLINDTRSGWDGTYKGQLLNSNVFVYMLEVELINGDTQVYKGDIFLAN